MTSLKYFHLEHTYIPSDQSHYYTYIRLYIDKVNTEIWLAISRDLRVFLIDPYLWGYIKQVVWSWSQTLVTGEHYIE